MDTLTSLKNRIAAEIPGLSLVEKAEMSKHTTFKAGGKAALLAEVRNVSELKSLLKIVAEEGAKSFFLGNGSNTLFRDGIYEGIVIKFAQDSSFNMVEEMKVVGDTCEFKVGAGMLMSQFARFAGNLSYTGFEALSGIPGTVGGAVFMNAGAYGSEIKDVLKCAHVVSYDGKEELDVPAGELELGYRHSKLEETKGIVIDVTFVLALGDLAQISSLTKDFMERRNSKQPLAFPSAGSTFKRPEGYFAGKLIEDSGLKGLTVGGAQVSGKHAGFVINKGGATATDIVELITLVKNVVYEKFGVVLEPEVRII